MKAIHTVLAIVFAAFLALPTAQKVFRILPSSTLGGVEDAVERPAWTLAGWFDGTLQPSIENRYTFRFPLRPHLVKSWNQLQYALCGTPPRHTTGTQVVIGRDNYLYEQPYIRTYNGNCGLAKADLKTTCTKVRRAQDILKARNIGFLLVIAPSKVEIYSEFVPAAMLTPGRHTRKTAYDRIVPLFREAGVNTLDMHAQFLEWKPTAPHPLFPKGGVHWNYYGAALTANRILDELRTQTGREFPRIVVAGVTTNATPEGSDGDLFNLLNLWGDFSLRSSASFRGVEVHPALRLEAVPSAVKPDLLIVGDSFALTLTEVMDRVRLYDRRDTLYYFNRIISYVQPGTGDPRDLATRQAGVPIDRRAFSIEDALRGRDAVIIEVNEQWLPKIGFGFIEAVLAMPPSAPAPTLPVDSD